MQVTTRYFQLQPDSELMASIVAKAKDVKAQHDKGRELMLEVGAERITSNGLLFNIFHFDNEPCRDTFKKAKGGLWTPKTGTRKGKELMQKIEALGQPIDLDEFVLKAVGLWSGPLVIDGYKAYRATCITSIPLSYLTRIPPFLIISMPWYEQTEESIKEMEQYKEWRKEKNGFNSSKDYFAQDHSIFSNPDVIELKKWEFEKAVFDRNELLEATRLEIASNSN